MGSLSMSTLSLTSRSDSGNPLSPFNNSGTSLRHGHPLINPLLFSFPFKPIKFRISPRPTNLKPPLIPSSSLKSPRPPLWPSQHKEFLKFLSEKLVIGLLGSFIFIGFVKLRPCYALSTPVSESTSKMGETQNLGNRNEAEEMYEKLLETDPTNVEALKVLVYGKMRKGKTREAIKYVERLMGVEPDEVEWMLLRALCYETMGQLSTAKKLFKEILEDRPLLLRALHGLAMVMHKNHEGTAVFEMLSKALELARCEHRVTEERNIRILIAQMHVVEGDMDAALKDFEELICDDPRDFRPYLCQGIIYSLLDKKKEAQEQFETYQSLVPEEFPQKGFLDDVVLAAKSKKSEQFQEEFRAEFRSSGQQV